MAKKKHTQTAYVNYSKSTQAQMEAVTAFLMEKYTTLQAEWSIALQMLATNLEMLQECSKQIKNDGLMVINRFGNYEKHPLLKVRNDAQIQAVKLLNEFGLTPKSLSKLKVEEQDTTEDFISALING